MISYEEWVRLRAAKEAFERLGLPMREEGLQKLAEGEALFGVRGGKVGQLAMTRQKAAAVMYLSGATARQIAVLMSITRTSAYSYVVSELKYQMPANRGSQPGVKNGPRLTEDAVQVIYEWLQTEANPTLSARQLLGQVEEVLRKHLDEKGRDIRESRTRVHESADTQSVGTDGTDKGTSGRVGTEEAGGDTGEDRGE